MRLQRLALHRLTRILSFVLPLAVLVFVAIAAWSYWSRTRGAEPEARSPDALPSDVAVVTEGFEHVRYGSNGKAVFRIWADAALGTKDNRNLLRNVEAIIPAQSDEEPDRYIKGQECSYDEQSGLTSCTRNVTVDLDERTVATTEHLVYDPEARLLVSPGRVTLHRPSEMTGKAGRMEYFVDTGLLRLSNNVEIRLEEGGALRGGIAAFQQRENWAVVSQGVEMESPNGWVRGGSGRAELSPGAYRPVRITVENGAESEARSSGSSFAVRSDWLRSDLSPATEIEHVQARGMVHAERTSGGLTDTLDAPEVEAWLDGSGRVSNLEARGKPEFTSAHGRLVADGKIGIDYDDSSLRTSGASTLTGKTFEISGRDFSIDEDRKRTVFSTSSYATLKSGERTTSADNTTIHLDAESALDFLEQTGNVTFSEGPRSGNGATLTMRQGGEIVELEGNSAEFRDDTRTLKAQRVVFNTKSGELSGEGRVRTTDIAPGKKPVFVDSARVEFREGLVDYRGDVRLLTPDGGAIEADRLRGYPQENRFEAEGKVYSKTGDLQVDSDRLAFHDFGQTEQTARYTGKVEARKTDREGILVLETPDLMVNLKGGIAVRIVAADGARVTQGARTGIGDGAEYEASTGDILLRGTKTEDAVVEDPEGVLRACSIQIKANGDKVLKPCSDRSITSSIQIRK